MSEIVTDDLSTAGEEMDVINEVIETRGRLHREVFSDLRAKVESRDSLMEGGQIWDIGRKLGIVEHEFPH